MKLSRYLPILDWGRRYNGAAFSGDLLAAVIVTIMLIPQSLAYALLAGLPAEAGLYASILPLVAYAIFGTSRALSVGPVAVVSLMTAAAVGNIAEAGSMGYVTAAASLAFLSGLFLLLMGVFRLGFLANFLSHPVISGFITASGLLIAASQLRHLLGIQASGHTIFELGASLFSHVGNTHLPTLYLGIATLVFLLFVRSGLKPVLKSLGFTDPVAAILTKTGPILTVAAAILTVIVFDLESRGVAVVGTVPQGLPVFGLPSLEPGLLSLLASSALLISVIGFVESVSVGQTLAAKRRQRIDPDQELVGLGASNIASSVSGGFPVTGGFSRSVVNFDAGAQTPAAGLFTAIGIALAAVFLTPLLYHLPIAVLAATIIVAVMSLVDFGALVRARRFATTDFAAMLTTIVITLVVGVETGVLAGVLLSLAMFLYETSRPHSAIVGLVPGTEHFRNIDRHSVITSPRVVTLRIDRALFFANARYLEDRVFGLVAEYPEIEHLILMCPAVNAIDLSALEALEAINHRLVDSAICLHLSEVKGPVMDRLERTRFVEGLSGEVFLSQYDAIEALAPELLTTAASAPPQTTAAK